MASQSQPIELYFWTTPNGYKISIMLEELGVMDQTAVTLCKENNLPLIVLNIHRPGAVAMAVRGEKVGTIVGG